MGIASKDCKMSVTSCMLFEAGWILNRTKIITKSHVVSSHRLLDNLADMVNRDRFENFGKLSRAADELNVNIGVLWAFRRHFGR